MDHEELTAALERDGAALGEIGIEDVDVPTCPGWSLPDLVHHVGAVHRFQLAQLQASDSTALAAVERLPRSEIPDLGAWYLEGLDQLVAVLRRTDPDRLTPSWFGPKPARFWARRAAVETAIHRWDAEAATGSAGPIDPSLAVEGLDELLEVVVPARLSGADRPPAPASIHLHATDVAGEWLIEVDGRSLKVTRVHAKGDVAARGTASDLLLLVAGRLPAARMEVFGDTSMLDAWQQSFSI